MDNHFTNGTFAFTMTREDMPSSKSKEPFFAKVPRKICILHLEY